MKYRELVTKSIVTRSILPYGVMAAISFSVGALEIRQSNTTLQMPTNPPQHGFVLEPLFPEIKFQNPLAIVVAPGETDRIFVVERPGRIKVIPNLESPQATTFLDITDRVVSGGETGLLAMAFHPDYHSNGFFYVWYTTHIETEAGSGLHNRLSRFSVSLDDRNVATTASEHPLISQYDESSNHNGGDLHFGPDGYLYIASGDEGSGDDGRDNSRFIDKDLFGGILRIDVDRRPENLAPNPHPAIHAETFAIPADNPFVNITDYFGQPVVSEKVRTEFYAVGLRNPWRFSFDSLTGELYCGDVGQNGFEEVNRIEKGKHYGWAYYEALRDGPRIRQAPEGFTAEPPLFHYPRVVGRSIIGGWVYRGDKYPELYGAYICADHYSGIVWAVHLKAGELDYAEELTFDNNLAGFGIDPRNGDILAADLRDGYIKKLTASDSQSGDPLPPRLSETGAFANLTDLKPNPGVVPYSINVPFWSDGALKQRWFSLPDPDHKVTFVPDAPWQFPSGMVWIKHFELELKTGNPDTRRRLETRFLVRNDQGVYGVTYRWNETQDDAELVATEGLTETFIIDENGAHREQEWRYPSRSECLQCHGSSSNHALGFNTEQLNRDHDYGEGPLNQIVTLSDIGYLSNPIDATVTLPKLSAAADDYASREDRVRSFLAVNCAYCHQPGGNARGTWDGRFHMDLDTTGIIDGSLINPLGDPARRVIAPGSLENSAILQRLTATDNTRMPPLGSTVHDQESIDMLSQWITDDLTHEQPKVARLQMTRNADDSLDLSWSDSNRSLVLETSTTLRNEDWTQIVTEGERHRVEVTSDRNVFFRLRRQ